MTPRRSNISACWTLAGPSAQFATRILGDLGADVIKIEPPGGDPLRSQPPFANGQPGPERSIPFLADNHNKRSIVLDLETGEGRESMAQACGHCGCPG